MLKIILTILAVMVVVFFFVIMPLLHFLVISGQQAENKMKDIIDGEER